MELLNFTIKNKDTASLKLITNNYLLFPHEIVSPARKTIKNETVLHIHKWTADKVNFRVTVKMLKKMV